MPSNSAVMRLWLMHRRGTCILLNGSASDGVAQAGASTLWVSGVLGQQEGALRAQLPDCRS